MMIKLIIQTWWCRFPLFYTCSNTVLDHSFLISLSTDQYQIWTHMKSLSIVNYPALSLSRGCSQMGNRVCWTIERVQTILCCFHMHVKRTWSHYHTLIDLRWHKWVRIHMYRVYHHLCFDQRWSAHHTRWLSCELVLLVGCGPWNNKHIDLMGVCGRGIDGGDIDDNIGMVM